VWGYTVEKADTCETCGHVEYTEVDSCWGFYGIDDCIEQAKAAAE